MTDRELMQMVLDALSNFDKGNHGMRWQVPLIKALRARLAQPKTAECDGGQCGIGGYCKQCPKTQPENEFNPDWDVMSAMVEEQQRMAKRIEELETQLGEAMWGYGEWRRKAEISSALCTRQGIRLMEYESQEKQKPVAWKMKGVPAFATSRPNDTDSIKWDALYTAPPQRKEWIGLTDEERREIISDTERDDRGYVMALVEAKLKDKNNAD